MWGGGVPGSSHKPQSASKNAGLIKPINGHCVAFTIEVQCEILGSSLQNSEGSMVRVLQGVAMGVIANEYKPVVLQFHR